MLAAGASDAWAILDRARDMVAAGTPVLSLSIGQPEESPPPGVARAVADSLAAGRTRYSPLLGEAPLRAAIAEARGARPEDVVVLPGAQHALLAVLSLLLGPGDEVITPDPHYATYAGTTAAAGGQLVPVAMEGPGFAPDIARLAAAITPATRAILVNTPGNPTGRALDVADFARLSSLCTAHGLWLISDEVYGALRYEGPHVSAWHHGPAGATVVLDSLSKSHAMTGYRLGWALAPESAAALFGVAQFVQDAGVAALATPAADLQPYLSGFARRARRLVERVGQLQRLATRMPDGGMFALVDVREVDPDDVRFANALLDEMHVAVMPGSGFGPGGRGHVRISLTPGDDRFEEALDRFLRFCAGRA